MMGGFRVSWAPECSADSGRWQMSFILSSMLRAVIRIFVEVHDLKKQKQKQKKGSADSS